MTRAWNPDNRIVKTTLVAVGLMAVLGAAAG